MVNYAKGKIAITRGGKLLYQGTWKNMPSKVFKPGITISNKEGSRVLTTEGLKRPRAKSRSSPRQSYGFGW